jgi:hypothetical protein
MGIGLAAMAVATTVAVGSVLLPGPAVSYILSEGIYYTLPQLLFL